MRQYLASERLYGPRVACLVGEPEGLRLPPYLFSLAIVTPRGLGTAAGGAANQRLMSLVPALYYSLRPFGGVAWLAQAELDGVRQALLGKPPARIEWSPALSATRLERSDPQVAHHYAPRLLALDLPTGRVPASQSPQIGQRNGLVVPEAGRKAVERDEDHMLIGKLVLRRRLRGSHRRNG